MKVCFFLTASLTVGLLAGCAAQRHPLVLAPVGPAIPAHASDSHTGSLKVYSAYDAAAHFYSRTFDGEQYSDYRIVYPDGQLVQRVHNNTDTMIEEPATVSLPPGKYNVVARANGYGKVTVPVVIEEHRETVVHLEGGDSWNSTDRPNKQVAVCLPDGSPVGYRAVE